MAGKQIVKTMTAKEVEKYSRIEGRHAVGGCPCLYIRRLKGSVSWVLRVLVNGRRQEIGLGAYPDVGLEEARSKCRDIRKQIGNGIDPLAEKNRTKQACKAAAAKRMTFSECMNAYLDAHEDTWKNSKHRQQWRNTLEHYAIPVFGNLAVADIDLALVMRCLEPIWRVKTETATRLRGRIEQVLDWAAVRGYRQVENPARWKGHLDKLLPAKSKVAAVEHHAALRYKEIGGFIIALRTMEGLAARALEFAILCASRSNEVRGATWSEVDLKARIWIIPAERMKMKREHRVPLSERAVELLETLPRIAGSDLVFPGRKGPMSDMTLTAVLRRMGQGDLTQHGFRSTFRDWAAEMTNYPNEVCEMALAHAVGDKVEAAYRRGDLFEKRRRIMEDWAKYCATKVSDDTNIVPIRKHAAA
jgi:integrase